MSAFTASPLVYVHFTMPDEKDGRNAFEPSHDKEWSPCNKYAVNYIPSNTNAELPPSNEFILPPSSTSIVSLRVLSLYDPENSTLHPNEVWCALISNGLTIFGYYLENDIYPNATKC